MDEEKQVNMSYNELCDIIKKYYKEKNIELDLMSNYSLISNIVYKKEAKPIFITRGDLGLVRFTLSLDDLNTLIIREYAQKNYEVIGDILYDEEGIKFTCITNTNAKEKECDYSLSNITYSSSMSYDLVRQLANEYYHKEYSQRLVFIDLRELESILREGKDLVTLNNESDFVTIPFIKIKEILIGYINDKGFKVKGLSFDNQILLSLEESPKEEKQKVEVVPTRFEEITPYNINFEEPVKKPEKKETTEEDSVDNEDLADLQSLIALPVHDASNDTLLDYESVNYRRKIHAIKVAIEEAEKKKRKYAILSLILAACSAVVITTKRNEMNKSVLEELEAFETWPTTIEYIEELGPLATILPVATGCSLYQYNKNRRLVKRLRKENDYE